jgi:hypothetical protein
LFRSLQKKRQAKYFGLSFDCSCCDYHSYRVTLMPADSRRPFDRQPIAYPAVRKMTRFSTNLFFSSNDIRFQILFSRSSCPICQPFCLLQMFKFVWLT